MFLWLIFSTNRLSACRNATIIHHSVPHSPMLIAMVMSHMFGSHSRRLIERVLVHIELDEPLRSTVHLLHIFRAQLFLYNLGRVRLASFVFVIAVRMRIFVNIIVFRLNEFADVVLRVARVALAFVD